MNWAKTAWLIVLLAVVVKAQDTLLTVNALETALNAKPLGAAADALVNRLRRTYGNDLAKPVAPKVDDLDVAWVIEAPGAKEVRVMFAQWQQGLPLVRIGETHVFAGVKHFGWGDAMRWQYEVDGKRIQAGNGQLEVYTTSVAESLKLQRRRC
jgi:hypothetical protein